MPGKDMPGWPSKKEKVKNLRTQAQAAKKVMLLQLCMVGVFLKMAKRMATAYGHSIRFFYYLYWVLGLWNCR